MVILLFIILAALAKGLFDRVTIYPDQFPKWWRRSNYNEWPLWKKLLPFLGDGWHLSGWLIFFFGWLAAQAYTDWQYFKIDYWYIHLVYAVFIGGYHDLALKGKFNSHKSN